MVKVKVKQALLDAELKYRNARNSGDLNAMALAKAQVTKIWNDEHDRQEDEAHERAYMWSL
tara:strand:+ start:451 stop:633 length:183 start_codon:yes stop_codon:yes gene_type:complete